MGHEYPWWKNKQTNKKQLKNKQTNLYYLKIITCLYLFPEVAASSAEADRRHTQ